MAGEVGGEETEDWGRTKEKWINEERVKEKTRTPKRKERREADVRGGAEGWVVRELHRWRGKWKM